MHNVLLVDNIDPIAQRILEESGQFKVDIKNGMTQAQTAAILGEYDAIILRSGTELDKKTLESSGKLKFIARAGAGYNNIDTAFATEKDIIVTNAPGQNSISVAELTLGHMLALAKNMMEANTTTHQGEWKKKELVGTELSGKKLGVIGGAGNIGSKVAMMGKLLGMQVVIYDVSDNESEFTRVTLDELLETSDFVTVHVPLLPATKHMLAMEQFEKMKPTAYLVDTARGGVVKEDDLVEAIKSGKLKGAAMDVAEEEPIAADNPMLGVASIHLSPHIGGNTKEAKVRCAEYCAQSIIEYFVNNRIRAQVN